MIKVTCLNNWRSTLERVSYSPQTVFYVNWSYVDLCWIRPYWISIELRDDVHVWPPTERFAFPWHQISQLCFPYCRIEYSIYSRRFVDWIKQSQHLDSEFVINRMGPKDVFKGTNRRNPTVGRTVHRRWQPTKWGEILERYFKITVSI